jgi:hypothetical protein
VQGEIDANSNELNLPKSMELKDEGLLWEKQNIGNADI